MRVISPGAAWAETSSEPDSMERVVACKRKCDWRTGVIEREAALGVGGGSGSSVGSGGKDGCALHGAPGGVLDAAAQVHGALGLRGREGE